MKLATRLLFVLITEALPPHAGTPSDETGFMDGRGKLGGASHASARGRSSAQDPRRPQPNRYGPCVYGRTSGPWMQREAKRLAIDSSHKSRSRADRRRGTPLAAARAQVFGSRGGRSGGWSLNPERASVETLGQQRPLSGAGKRPISGYRWGHRR